MDGVVQHDAAPFLGEAVTALGRLAILHGLVDELIRTVRNGPRTA